MYFNLLQEIEKKGFTKRDVAKAADIKYSTLLDRLKGRHPFGLDEAIVIRDRLFPGMNIEYLFATDNEKEAVK